MNEQRRQQVLEIIRNYDTDGRIKPWSDYAAEYKRYWGHCNRIGAEPGMTLSELAYIIIDRKHEFVMQFNAMWNKCFANCPDAFVATVHTFRALGLPEEIVTEGRLQLDHFRDGNLALANAVLEAMGAPQNGAAAADDHEAYMRCLTSIRSQLGSAMGSGRAQDVIFISVQDRSHIQRALVTAGAHDIGVESETSVLPIPPEPITQPHQRNFVVGEFRLQHEPNAHRIYRLRICYGNA